MSQIQSVPFTLLNATVYIYLNSLGEAHLLDMHTYGTHV